MVNVEKTIENLKSRGFDAKSFASGSEAVDYLASQLKSETVGFGGSMTLEALGLYDRLVANNRVFWHWRDKNAETYKEAMSAKVYITSANAVAQTGEIINIDGTGNRVVNTLYGKKKVYIIVGTNKLAEDYDKALWRARNIASPLNARRLGKNTPCAKGELKCYDCKSPDRICKGLVVLWNKMNGTEKVEVIIINEELGY
ncbi:MAG: lactate utilization protein [Oscillospiraceae bacterium]|nr:lactate utilization protein [Oscillospiraceae bacterium]